MIFCLCWVSHVLHLVRALFFTPVLDTANISLPILGPQLYPGSQVLPLLHTLRPQFFSNALCPAACCSGVMRTLSLDFHESGNRLRVTQKVILKPLMQHTRYIARTFGIRRNEKILCASPFAARYDPASGRH
ncbi:hypothetical protein C8J57DRAFT_674637 [Mycena rebaudengoi]|nr:hypothetical protein C8J57DRAFT_674637 [Mycena rebaudengoi]